MEKTELTYLVLGLAPFAPAPESGYRPRLTVADPADLDAAVKAVAPGFYIPLPANLCPASGIDLRINSLKDFHPDELIKTAPYLRQLREAAVLIRQSLDQGAGAIEIYDRLQAFPDLPVQISRPAAAPAASAPSTSALDDLLSMVAAPSAPASPSGGDARPEQWASELEATLASILFRVVSDENFRRAETAWRGLELLCRQAGDDGRIALALCPSSEAVLAETLEALKEGLPDSPSLVVADFGFDNTTRSFDLLRQLAEFGETMLAPVVTGIGPRFFGIKTWDEVDKLPFLPHLLDNAAWAKWRKLRKEGAADWLVAAANRIPSRPAFGKKNPAAVEFAEAETPWTGAAWVPAALMVKRAAETGWPTRFDDRRCRLSGLPASSGSDGPVYSEARFSEERVRQLAEIGVTPIAAEDGEALAVGAVTAAGNPANYQLALSRVIGLILWLRGQGGDGDTEGIAGGLRAALSKLWQAAGASLPEETEVAAFEDDVRGGIAVRVAVTPGKEILPSPQVIELTLNW